MARYNDPPSRAERVRAIAAVIAVHGALAALVLTGSNIAQSPAGEAPTEIFDVTLPPPPPLPPPEPKREAAAPRDAGSEGKKAAPIVAPPARLPPTNPLPAAPVAGSGNAPTAGAGTLGTGPGAGGSGSGPGGGGTGTGGGIGEDARLLSGGLGRGDYRRLRAFASPSGRAVLALLIGPDGRVSQCSTRQSSGDPSLDASLCQILQPRMRWAPARDRAGRPLTVGIYYTAVWSRDGA
jgi:protein TonB